MKNEALIEKAIAKAVKINRDVAIQSGRIIPASKVKLGTAYIIATCNKSTIRVDRNLRIV